MVWASCCSLSAHTTLAHTDWASISLSSSFTMTWSILRWRCLFWIKCSVSASNVTIWSQWCPRYTKIITFRASQVAATVSAGLSLHTASLNSTVTQSGADSHTSGNESVNQVHSCKIHKLTETVLCYTHPAAAAAAAALLWWEQGNTCPASRWARPSLHLSVSPGVRMWAQRVVSVGDPYTAWTPRESQELSRLPPGLHPGHHHYLGQRVRTGAESYGTSPRVSNESCHFVGLAVDFPHYSHCPRQISPTQHNCHCTSRHPILHPRFPRLPPPHAGNEHISSSSWNKHIPVKSPMLT